MGFYEDDRIRDKNRAINQAHAIYDGYVARGWTNGDIQAAMEEQLTAYPNNRVIYEVFKMAVRASAPASDLRSTQD